MNIDLLANFFLWCTILNAGLLVLTFLMAVFAGDFIYRQHSRWFPMPRETFRLVLYSFIGLYKILVFVFNLVPWLALTLLK